MSINDKLLDIKEVAEILDVHWQTVRSYIKRGELRSHKVGRNVRIQKSDLDNFIRGQKQKEVKEIEIRFATNNRKRIEKRLLELGAKIVYHGHVVDHVYVPKFIKSIQEKDKWFISAKGYSVRIREQDNGYTGNITVSLEVKRLAEPNKYEVCLESEFRIDDARQADSMLNLIDHKRIVSIDKDRLVYKFKDVKIVIDDFKDFKTGVELEINTGDNIENTIKKLRNTAKDIGLDLKKEISHSSVTFEYLKEFARF